MRLAAALAWLASSAAASSWVRTKPESLRAGSPTDGVPICLVPDLRRYAHRLPWDFAPSRDNPINCGADGGEASNYVLATIPRQPYEMHVISVDGGSFPILTGDPTAPDHSVQVVVYKTLKPAVLVLAARDPVLWDVTVTPEARLELVVLQGRGTQVLRGVPDDVPVVKRSWEQACAYAHAWEPSRNVAGPDLGLMLASLRCSTGLRESSFQGCQSGAVFEVPPYREEPAKAAESWDPPCPLAVDPDVPLARRLAAARAPMKAPPGWDAPAPPRPAPAPAMREEAAGLAGDPEVLPVPRGLDAAEGPKLDADARREAAAERTAGGDVPEAPAEGQKEDLAAPRGAGLRDETDAGGSARREAADARTPPARSVDSRVSGTKETLPAPRGPATRADIPVRALAILLRGQTTLLTHDAVPDLVIALERGDETLRWRAADALGQLGADAAKAVPPLLDALGSDSWRVRSSAALALGNIGAKPKKVVKRLRKLLRDKHPDVRDSAKTALIRLGIPV